ncbi:MAG: ATP-binding protein [Tannerellaceae bacterium]|jgi:predicted AAA+ superfamily ATPase|nr:ATP-binding protein [Tannerellaceae bacterium]
MIIEREILKQLACWKAASNRQPLILRGARQIGKTWVMKEFGKRHFESVAYFNFEEVQELKDTFSTTKNVQRILGQLALYTDTPIRPETTLLLFDEIQECNDALNSLKYFCENAPEYAIIAAGSLLGVTLSKGDSFPVGKVDFMQMYPITFKEFLFMESPDIFDYMERKETLEELPSILFNRLAEAYRKYQVSGGMPQAVNALLENRGMEETETILQNILQAYVLDFSKHAETKNIPRITSIWNSIPSQLSKENRKFIYQLVKPGARAREYEDALLWLQQAGLVYLIFNNKKPFLPLSAYDDLTTFKIYLSDIGLLRRLAKLPPDIILHGSAIYAEFKGAMAENFVLQSLITQFETSPRYWTSEGKAEVDFIIQSREDIFPIEVKSGQHTGGKSLIVYNNLYHPQWRIRYSVNNLRLDDNLLNIPIFLVDWTKKLIEILHSS